MTRKRIVQITSMFVLVSALVANPRPAHAGYEDGQPPYPCWAGGPGSSSCSVSGCQVTCTSGWYACCGQTTGPCHCYQTKA